MSTLVIGLGELHRGDDAVGLLVAEQVHRELPEVEVQMVSSPTRLVDAWDARSDVVVIDAIRSGRDIGEITVIHVGDDPLPAHPGAGGSHGFGVAEAVELSRALGRLPERLVVVGIEAADFTQGAELTPAVGDAVEVATEVVVELLPDSEVL